MNIDQVGKEGVDGCFCVVADDGEKVTKCATVGTAKDAETLIKGQALLKPDVRFHLLYLPASCEPGFLKRLAACKECCK